MRYKRNNLQKFTILIICSLILMFVFSILSMLIGQKKILPSEVLKALFKYDGSFNHQIVRDFRLPRVFAGIFVGASLSVTGAIMQGNTKNPLADSGLMGITSGSMFSVILLMTYLPQASIYTRIGISSLGAGLATALIYLIAYIGRKGLKPERMILSGMAISTLFGSIATAIVLQNGKTAEMIRYMSGSVSNANWDEIFVALPIFIVGIIMSIALSRTLTVMNLGDDISYGLGANIKATKIISTVIVFLLSAIAFIIIGPVAYIGLMVPHVVRKVVGTDYRLVLPSSIILGSTFILIMDFIARNIHRHHEFPIGILIAMLGVPFFILISRRSLK